MAKLTKEELDAHATEMWRRCFEYVKAKGLENTTTGILILRELVEDASQSPNMMVIYVGDPRNAAMTMARAAQAELAKANATGPQS